MTLLENHEHRIFASKTWRVGRSLMALVPDCRSKMLEVASVQLARQKGLSQNGYADGLFQTETPRREDVPRGTCNLRSLCNTRIFLCRFSALGRCIDWDVQHADSSVTPGLRARSVARSGTCSGAQVAYENSVPRSLNRFRRLLCPWQAGYPMLQDRSRLTHRMYLSMNSRYTIFVA